jgi:hypothetical protein
LPCGVSATLELTWSFESLLPSHASPPVLPALERKRAAFGKDVRGRSQREKIPGGGASGYCVRNRIEAGGADCPSVSSGLAVRGESEIGGFLGGSTTVCGFGSLRARLDFLLWCPGELLRDFLRRNERRLWRGTGQPYDFVRGVRGIEPTGNVSSQVIDRSAPPDTEARGKGDRNERNPSTGAH